MGWVLKRRRKQHKVSLPGKLEVIRNALLADVGPRKAVTDYFEKHGLEPPKNPKAVLYNYRTELRKRLENNDKEAIRLAEAYGLIDLEESTDVSELSGDNVAGTGIHDSL